MKGHIRAVKLLLDAGADRLAEDTGNTSAEEKAWEHILTNRGSAADLSQLRVYFPDYDIDRWGFSNLHKAILGLAGHLNSVMLNPPAAFDIDAPDVRGRTPLHWAALRADLPAVSFLLDAGASVHAVDLTNSTPLSYAVSSAIPDMVQLLIRHGANVNAVNNRGDSPLHYAARHKDDLRTVKMLVNAGALVDSRNSLGNTPFAGAAITNRVAAGRYLLGRGADRYSANMYGDTPLRETVQHNCHDFLKMLLDGGTRYDDVNKRGSTVLHTLALEGDTRTAEILVAAGVEGLDPERRNGDGKAAMEVLEGRARLPSGFNEAFTGLLACLKAPSG
jgi:ankyrin repeat protein